MANTGLFYDLIPTLYRNLDVPSREIVGLIAAASKDIDVQNVAKGQYINSFVTPNAVVTNVTPGQLPPDDGDQAFGYKQLQISKERRVGIKWNGNEQMGVNSGPGAQNMLVDQITQAMRAITNEVAADLAAAAVAGGSRVVVPSGTNLFDAANYLDMSNCIKELNINGAPQEDRYAILNPSAAARFRGNSTYTQASAAGADGQLRRGLLLDQFNTSIGESIALMNATHTKGDAALATTDTAGYAVGDTVITLASAGTGAILAGDYVSFDGDSNNYLVVSGDADVSGGGTITIAAPGLLKAIAGSATDITVGAKLERNVVMSQNALHLATRLPARPAQGDLAMNVTTVTDPVSGLTFEVSMYNRYREVQIEVALAWGVLVAKPEHLILLAE